MLWPIPTLPTFLQSISYFFVPKASHPIKAYFAEMPPRLVNPEAPFNNLQEEILTEIIGVGEHLLKLKNWMRSVLDLNTCNDKEFEIAFNELLPQIKKMGTKDAISSLLTGLYLLLNTNGAEERTRKQRELLISHLSVMLDGDAQYLPSRHPLKLHINVNHIDDTFLAQLDAPKESSLTQQKAIKIAALMAIAGFASAMAYASRNVAPAEPTQLPLSPDSSATLNAQVNNSITPHFNEVLIANTRESLLPDMPEQTTASATLTTVISSPSPLASELPLEANPLIEVDIAPNELTPKPTAFFENISIAISSVFESEVPDEIPPVIPVVTPLVSPLAAPVDPVAVKEEAVGDKTVEELATASIAGITTDLSEIADTGDAPVQPLENDELRDNQTAIPQISDLSMQREQLIKTSFEPISKLFSQSSWIDRVITSYVVPLTPYDLPLNISTNNLPPKASQSLQTDGLKAINPILLKTVAITPQGYQEAVSYRAPEVTNEGSADFNYTGHDSLSKWGLISGTICAAAIASVFAYRKYMRAQAALRLAQLLAAAEADRVAATNVQAVQLSSAAVTASNQHNTVVAQQTARAVAAVSDSGKTAQASSMQATTETPKKKRSERAKTGQSPAKAVAASPTKPLAANPVRAEIISSPAKRSNAQPSSTPSTPAKKSKRANTATPQRTLSAVPSSNSSPTRSEKRRNRKNNNKLDPNNDNGCHIPTAAVSSPPGVENSSPTHLQPQLSFASSIKTTASGVCVPPGTPTLSPQGNLNGGGHYDFLRPPATGGVTDTTSLSNTATMILNKTPTTPASRTAPGTVVPSTPPATAIKGSLPIPNISTPGNVTATGMGKQISAKKAPAKAVPAKIAAKSPSTPVVVGSALATATLSNSAWPPLQSSPQPKAPAKGAGSTVVKDNTTSPTLRSSTQSSTLTVSGILSTGSLPSATASYSPVRSTPLAATTTGPSTPAKKPYSAVVAENHSTTVATIAHTSVPAVAQRWFNIPGSTSTIRLPQPSPSAFANAEAKKTAAKKAEKGSQQEQLARRRRVIDDSPQQEATSNIVKGIHGSTSEKELVGIGAGKKVVAPSSVSDFFARRASGQAPAKAASIFAPPVSNEAKTTLLDPAVQPPAPASPLSSAPLAAPPTPPPFSPQKATNNTPKLKRKVGKSVESKQVPEPQPKQEAQPKKKDTVPSNFMLTAAAAAKNAVAAAKETPVSPNEADIEEDEW